MIPIIYLQGSTASGKGALGSKLAAEFNMYHLSLGEVTRALGAATREPIAGVPNAAVNAFIARGQPIPDPVLAQLPAVPAALLVHNAHARAERALPDLIQPILREKIAEISAGPRAYAAIILDGYPLRPGHVREARELIPGAAVAALVIAVECPEEVARARYLARGGGRPNTAGAFERRMRGFEIAREKVLQMMREDGATVVRAVNDGSVTVEQAYEGLRRRLGETPAWRELVGGASTTL